MADHQDRAWAVNDLLFEPNSGWDVEIVVGLVEQQHVGTRGQEQVQHHSFTFAARELANLASAEVVDRCFYASFGGGRPSGFELVAAQIAPGRDRFGEQHAIVGAIVHGFFGNDHGLARSA